MGIRGTQDLFGKRFDIHNQIQQHFNQIANQYGAQCIQSSALDSIDLFVRTSGQDADICQKEMFVVTNRNNTEHDNSVVLKPEGTAPTIRALQEQNIIFNQFLAVSYFDRMYRYSRPQKGRLREFTQAGIEFFGTGALIDAQAIKSACDFLEKCKILEHVGLKINTVGNNESRLAYTTALHTFFMNNKHKLSEATYEKAISNPLRALDKLTDEEKKTLPDMPLILDHLDQASKIYFENTLKYLDYMNVKYEIDQTIVRGLDYYTHTVFEFVGSNSASQGTVLAGGRYDHLIPILTNQNCSAIGWAAGVERLLILQEELQVDFTVQAPTKLYIISLDTDLRCLSLANHLRQQNKSIVVLQNIKLDKALKQIHQNNGKYVVISGNDEEKNNSWSFKDMDKGENSTFSEQELINKLNSIL